MPGQLERLYSEIPSDLREASEERVPVRVRIAESVEDLKAASHLVYTEYLRRGYIRPNPSELKLSLYHALPQTVTFLAEDGDGRVRGTVTLIEDSPLHLPMDEAYQSELNSLRRQGHRLAEVSMLTLDPSMRRPGMGLGSFQVMQMGLTIQLFKLMFDYARVCTDVTELVACFHPRHDVLYEFLRLQRLGGLRSYSVVNGKPAVARHLNVLDTGRQDARDHDPVLRFFYDTPSSPGAFAGRLLLSPDDLQELFIRCCPVFAAASASELSHLEQCYSCELPEPADLQPLYTTPQSF